MSNSGGTSAHPETNKPNARSRACQPTPPVSGFGLTGVSDLPDPATHAYRKDLADTALAGRVIASHYAEPLVRHVACDTELRAMADEAAEIITGLAKGDLFRMLDNSRGWAWGYAPDGRVGYIRSDAVGA